MRREFYALRWRAGPRKGSRGARALPVSEKNVLGRLSWPLVWGSASYRAGMVPRRPSPRNPSNSERSRNLQAASFARWRHS